ncbi:putative Mn2+ efflux pump MntP [Rhizobium metallidurans]|uniref:Putative manganese efflux pump MntP n=2 Tax=Rhizobium metallidurans TaxID=1265931 RepID=A0A7W6CUZ0_9HYPH|nr:putative Mn2+ efflux pump MntP [Rhizobium metallidurans]
MLVRNARGTFSRKRRLGKTVAKSATWTGQSTPGFHRPRGFKMSFVAIVVLAFSMSMDAFAVSVGRGAALGRTSVRDAVWTGVVFGVVEAITPMIGWVAGVAAASYVSAVDHWIAFGLLAAVGTNMVYSASKGGPEDETKPGMSFVVLVATAIGTSLDAMAVGVSLAFLQVNILVIAAAIGAATFLLSSGGMLVGRLIGERFGRIAEGVAGVALIALGSSILYEHIFAA